MAAYQEMKDSGIPGVGVIPSDWKITRVKNIFVEINDRCANSDDYELLSVSEYYGVAKRRDKITSDRVITNAASLDGYKICKPNDLVSNIMLAWKNSMGVSDYTGIVSPAYCVYRAKVPMCQKYFHYLFRTKTYGDLFKQYSTGIINSRLRLYTEKFFAIICPMPSVAEQHIIAEYLDQKSIQIDSIITEAKASIEDYKQWKASIIYEAVTKGLVPNVKMKDSEVEWIGKIPAAWSMCRLKNLVALIESGVSVNASQSKAAAGKVGVLKTSSVSKYIFNPDENKEVNEEELSRVSCPVKGNTIIVSRMNTPDLVGACGYVQQDYPNLFLPDRLWQVHFNDAVYVKYIWYYLCSNDVRNYYSSLSSGTSSSMQNISQGQFGNVHVILPAKDKQIEIAEYLDEICSTIDSLITEKESLITDLEAYKKSLIYEVVTGKRRVI